MNCEISHYVVTAHQPGGVLLTAKCNFLSPHSTDIIVAKSRRLEVRQYRSNDESLQSLFPVVLTVPINGRITSLLPFSVDASPTSYLFMTTDKLRYAVVSYDASVTPYPFITHASGSVKGEDHNVLGRLSESAPLVSIDPLGRCVVMHIYDGLLTVLPIDPSYRRVAQATKGEQIGAAVLGWSSATRPPSVLKEPFHARIEERTILALTFLHTGPDALPHICLLYQDSRGAQHVTSHVLHVHKRQIYLYGSHVAPSTTEWIQRKRIDGGSSLLIPIQPRTPVAAASTSSSVANNSVPRKSSPAGMVILGQRQITYISSITTKVIPVPSCLFLTWDDLPPDPNGMPRFLLGDEFGNLHMLTLVAISEKIVGLQIDTLGSCTLSSALSYLGEGLAFVGSNMGDSQVIQILEEPISMGVEGGGGGGEHDEAELDDSTYITVVEEYTHLGPIVDFDLVPTAPGSANDNTLVQSQVITASGTSRSGTLRLIRNGIGMNEYASVEIPGIQNMWSLRKSFHDVEDAYLVQSFVGQTRVLGVFSTPEEELHQYDEDVEAGGTLEEVCLPGLDASSSTLYVANVQIGDRLVQITESEIRLIAFAGDILDIWSPHRSSKDHIDIDPDELISVAAGNEAGQIVVALRGGLVLYLVVEDDKLLLRFKKEMDHEVSCINLHPFERSNPMWSTSNMSMDIDGDSMDVNRAKLVAVGFWDDFTVRLLSLEAYLGELLEISLCADEDEETEESPGSNAMRRNRDNMMARSLCLVTLDSSSSSGGGGSGGGAGNNGGGSASSSPGVDMLFVGLGDGTLISFAVVNIDGKVLVQSKKEVCLGTQRINLIPLRTEQSGTCVLATGDRPTVIYLAGVGGTSINNFNPKLCYSNVNLQASEEEEGDDISRPSAQQGIVVNVAEPFYSPILFDAASMSKQHHSLCVADDSKLRLGVIDDIQKLHVTTCRLGMSPRRIVHCPAGRLFAVGCIESGINQVGLGPEETNMENCIRFLDDTTFDDIERINLEPHEMILSMVYASLRIKTPATAKEARSEAGGGTPNDESKNNTAGMYKPFLLCGTAFALPDEDEPTRGRMLVFSCGSSEEEAASSSTNNHAVRQVAELQVRGGVYSLCQFYEGKILASVNSKTHICQLSDEGTGILKLSLVGLGHHGHILSLFVKSRAEKIALVQQQQKQQEQEEDVVGSSAANGTMSMDTSRSRKITNPTKKSKPKQEVEMLAIVGDLMRSISVVQYYPEHDTLEEIARDFNTNWTTAIEMLTDDVYLGGENWNNLFVLRRNANGQSDEARCRLDTIGEFHLGEMCNKFMRGSLVMPQSNGGSNAAASSSSHRRPTSMRRLSTGISPKKKSDGGAGSSGNKVRRPTVTVGSQTLFGTVDGTLGSILGLDARTTCFFSSLERSMNRVIKPVGDFSHQYFRAFEVERRIHPSHGFIDGDLVESFLDLDRSTMVLVVREMNRDGRWDTDSTDASSFGGVSNSNTTNATNNTTSSGARGGGGGGRDRFSSGGGGKNNVTADMELATDDTMHPVLCVDDVVAIVEEMTMLH